eukprot:363581-Chlamydomonas_euryale.AAC.2
MQLHTLRIRTPRSSTPKSSTPRQRATQEVKTIASEIVKSGAALHDAIGAEQELKEHRARAIAGHVDTEFVERSINEAVAQVWKCGSVEVCGGASQGAQPRVPSPPTSTPNLRDATAMRRWRRCGSVGEEEGACWSVRNASQ